MRLNRMVFSLVVLGGTSASLLTAPSLRAAPSLQPPAPAAARERRLHVARAESSSYLVNDWNKFQENYLPLYVADDDPKTAWTLKTEGLGEWLRLHVTPMAGATRVRLNVRNGYQKSAKLFAANSRAQGLTVVLLPSKKTVDVELKDASDWQEIALEQPAGPLEAVELRVRSVYPGKKYDDLCLSDVQLFVTATTPDNPAYEKQHLEKVLAWKAERLAAAKLFATELGQSLPLAAQYVPGADGGPSKYVASKCETDLCRLKEELARAKSSATNDRARAAWKVGMELAAKDFADLPVARIGTRDKRKVPRIDGTCSPALDSCLEDPCYAALPLPHFLGFLNAATLVLTEQTGLPSLADVMEYKPAVCKTKGETSFAYVSREPAKEGGGPGPVRALVLATCGAVEGREGSFPAAQASLLVYGPDGELEIFAESRRASLLEWKDSPSGRKIVRGRVTDPEWHEPRTFVAAQDATAP